MKLIKKITAAVTAMAMAAGMMSIGAGAATWSVFFSSSNGIKYVDQKNFASTSTINYFYDSCNNYYQTNNNYGYPAYVDYWAYCVDSAGNTAHACTNTPNFAYYSTQSKTKRNLTWGCEAYYTFVVKHHLNGNGNTSSMSGSVSLT